ncbi:hypothetical protein ACF06W_11700 [Streptomyces albus]|uniref:hypothetical protein n=1 Tax=Streptomyces albus TaxID=1888 RepID=UPI0036FE698E
MSHHWAPPNRGKINVVNSLNTGEFPTMGSESHNVTWARPTNGSVRSRSALSKTQDPTHKTAAHRSHRSASASETYGPTGIVAVSRSYHGPGCPCCATTGARPVSSAFGVQENFHSGTSTGYKAG